VKRDLTLDSTPWVKQPLGPVIHATGSPSRSSRSSISCAGGPRCCTAAGSLKRAYGNCSAGLALWTAPGMWTVGWPGRTDHASLPWAPSRRRCGPTGSAYWPSWSFDCPTPSWRALRQDAPHQHRGCGHRPAAPVIAMIYLCWERSPSSYPRNREEDQKPSRAVSLRAVVTITQLMRRSPDGGPFSLAGWHVQRAVGRTARSRRRTSRSTRGGG
jgi:hypothetical protein